MKLIYKTILLLCATIVFFGGAFQAIAAGPMDQGWGWSTSYFQILGDDFSCAANEVRYDVEYVDIATDEPVNAPALLALFDKDTGNTVTFRYATDGSVGSVCFNPDEHEISVSVEETSSYHPYWSMYREENPASIPRQKHVVGKVWLTSKDVSQADYEHTFPSIGTDEILNSSPDFEATVNQLPNLLGASDLSEATVFVYDLIGLSLVDTYTTPVSGGTGLKDLGTVALPDGRYSWGFYLGMDATHDAGSLLSTSGQPNSSFSGLSGNFRIDSTDPTFSTLSHSPSSPNESENVNLQVTARDQASNGYYSGIRQVRVYFDGSLVRTCNQASSEVQAVGCNVNVGALPLGTYSYYAETEDWAGNVYLSGTSVVSVSEFFNSQGTINGTSCNVATGASTCTMNLNWTTSDFVGTPNVVNQSTSDLISTDTSGSLGVPANPDADIFRLTDTGEGSIFSGDTYNANVGCADSNAYWTGTTCALQPAGAINGTSCSILTGDSSCQITLTWTTSNFVGTPRVYRDSTDVLISSAVSGSENLNVSPNDDVFALIDTGADSLFSGASYNANVGCAEAGAIWNGSECSPQPTGSISGTGCVVARDASTCTASLSWSSEYFFGTPTVKQGGPVISNAPSANSFSVQASPSSDVFTLSDTGSGSPFPGDSVDLGVTCASGTLWDGSICSESAYDEFQLDLLRQSCSADEFFDEVSQTCLKKPTASITGTTCSIAAEASTCEVFLNWGLNDPVGNPVVRRGTNVLLSGTANASGYSVMVSPSSDRFSISDDGFQSGSSLASFDANVGCVSGYFWNDSFCQAIPAGSISGSTCGVATGGSSCDLLLTWTAEDFFGTPNVRRTNPLNTISTALSGTNVVVQAGPDSDVFQLVDTGAGTIFPGDTFDANVKCADAGSAWNGSVCILIPEGTIGGTTCTVPTGDSSCQIMLTWTTSDFVGSPNVSRSSGVFISDAVSGSQPMTVSPSNDIFTLEDTGAGTLFSSKLYNANVTCSDSGSVWNGTSCIPQPIGTLAYSSGCQILTGDSTCQAAITWSTTNFVGTPAIRQGLNLLSSAESATNFPVTVRYGNNQVRLQDTGAGTTLNDIVRNYNASCADPEDAWNGSVCAPDLQSGFAVSGQGQVSGCPEGEFLSNQTGQCELLPIVFPDLEEAWTRYGRVADIAFFVQGPYEVTCSVADGDNADESIEHNSGAGTDSEVISYEITTRSLTSTQIVTITCTADGMDSSVVEQMRVNLIPIAEEI